MLEAEYENCPKLEKLRKSNNIKIEYGSIK